MIWLIGLMLGIPTVIVAVLIWAASGPWEPPQWRGYEGRD